MFWLRLCRIVLVSDGDSPSFLMATASKPYYTEAEYLTRERLATYKSEYYRGELFAKAGATREHNLLVTNILRSLANQLVERPCEVYPSDMRIRLPTGL